MARLWQSGFELDSATTGVEFSTSSGTIQNTTVRNGSFAGAVTSATSGTFKGFGQQIVSTDTSGPFYFRFYLNITTLPNANTTIGGFQNLAGSNNTVTVTLTTTGVLQLRVANGATQVGSNSSTLNTGQWYRIELQVNATPATGSRVAELLLDGSTVATSSTLTSTQVVGIASVFVGANLIGETATTLNLNFDDLAINNNVGTPQSNYPGVGNIIHLNPNAAGTSAGWTKGGSAPAATNWQGVNETPPDDAVTFNSATTAGTVDTHNLTNFGNTGATINVVSVGLRHRRAAVSPSTFSARMLSGATGQSGNSITPVTNFVTNSTAGAGTTLYPLTTYVDPNTSAAWTPAALDALEAGYIVLGTITAADQVTKVWVSVDYVPAVAPTVSGGSTLSMMGVG